MQANVANIHTVDLNLSLFKFDKAEQSLQNGRFASSSSAHYANLHSRLYFEAQLVYTWLEKVSITHSHVFEYDLALVRPLLSTANYFSLLVTFFFK